MKIGFLLLRQPFLKTMGALIDASLEAGHEVFIFYQPNAMQGEKAYQNVTSDNIPDFAGGQVKVVEFELDDFKKLHSEYALDIVVTHEGYHVLHGGVPEKDFKYLQDNGIKLVSLCHFFETSQQPLEALTYFDKTLYMSEYARELHYELHGAPRQLAEDIYGHLGAVVGAPLFDPICGSNPDQIRKALDIPAGKKVVLFSSPVLSALTPWRFAVWREPSRWTRTKNAVKQGNWGYLPEIWTGNSFKDTVAAVRDFCDRQEAYLIVKSRVKQEDPDYLIRAADLYLDGSEDRYYPIFTTYELLAVADLCVTVMSMTAPEAVAAGVPVLNIYVPATDYDSPPSEVYVRYLETLLSNQSESMMNYPGAIHTIDRRKIVAWLENRKIEDVPADADAQSNYQEKYLGINGKQKSSARILDLFEELVEQPSLALEAR
ncbi:MAG: hypothetical protein DWQ07_09315 [Chloroflexi bacterium]|nr:MAG: hypothetical protein DWQ07_09315 [Chloroflexota bacterium]MBL1193088.1 hypothetical protein [Chloroflexota bacterium]NOH10381.1 hypothetical protein [Chloroflexota bacterium]